ncbi:hypothetical protein [Accumulibacter sp.]|uniref:hypothetical protein n=1 Tax=Accumulibacter sp. TaxID=2053492 RepID=UPI0025DC5968|nr:hypothetical protein [Accumulibacter sp.]MCM8612075.1 hypothetical protein [Accumulibacter sp.]MCM8635741.1 hypothetical protein [Accumulibacter sp.]MCM8639624.1 hypothetical protein [Accumulibacter sp.]
MSARQLDLFRDSREVALVNDVIAAFRAGECERARYALAALRAEAPKRSDLAAFAVLLAFLAMLRDTDFATLDGDRVEELLGEIDADVAPAARALGSEAKGFLDRIWTRLATAVACRPFDPARPQIHAAALYLRAQADAEAEAAASPIADGWNDPVILRWRAFARCRDGGLQAARWQIFSLAWFATDSFPQLLAELAVPQLESDWRRFQSAIEMPDASWFPAWCLLPHPEFAAALAGEISPAIRGAAAGIPGLGAFLALTKILAIEPGGYSRELVEERARLQAIDAIFFAAYMRSRAVRHR